MRTTFSPFGPRQVESPYLTSREALVYLRLGSLSALYTHIRENKLPVCRVGRLMRFDIRDLDAWMRHQLHLVPSERSKPGRTRTA